MFYTSASGCHVGRPSAAAHLHFLDGGIARFGSSNDLEIFHQASNNVSYIQQTVAAQHLIIKNTSASATGSIYIEPRHGQSAAKFDGTTGEVSLSLIHI